MRYRNSYAAILKAQDLCVRLTWRYEAVFRTPTDQWVLTKFKTTETKTDDHLAVVPDAKNSPILAPEQFGKNR